MTREGFGFVIIPDREDDVFIPQSRMLHALNGDLVRVAVTRKKDLKHKMEGEIVAILESEKIRKNGVVRIDEDINIDDVTEKTNGFNGSDISNLLDKIEEISIVRGIRSGEKYICANDFAEALEKIHSSVQTEDIVKLKEWRLENDS